MSISEYASREIDTENDETLKWDLGTKLALVNGHWELHNQW